MHKQHHLKIMKITYLSIPNIGSHNPTQHNCVELYHKVSNKRPNKKILQIVEQSIYESNGLK